MNLMNVLRRAGAAASVFTGRKEVATSADLLALAAASGWARSGQYVSWANAMCVSAVLACVRVIAEDIAKVPLRLYQGDDQQRAPASKHPLYNLVGRQPNSWQSKFEFVEMLIASAVLCGNGYAYIVRGIGGRIIELIPLPPSCVFVRRPIGTWDLVYVVTLPNGGGTIQCKQSDILHLRGLSLDGMIGMDIVRMAREAIGLAIAAEEQQAKFAKGGLRSSGFITYSGKLTDEQKLEFIKFWKENYTGAANSDVTPLLDGGADFKPNTTSGKDAEVLPTRTFQVEEIARAFRVYPILIGSSSGLSSRSSITDIFAAHVAHCLQPWAVRLEQTLDMGLLTVDEIAQGYFFQVVLQGLLRGSPQERAQYYHSGIMDGWFTRNQARVEEGYNPLPGLDEPLQPLNMQVAPDTDTDDPAGAPGDSQPEDEPGEDPNSEADNG